MHFCSSENASALLSQSYIQKFQMMLLAALLLWFPPQRKPSGKRWEPQPASLSSLFNLESSLPSPHVRFYGWRVAKLPAIDRGTAGCSAVSSELPAVTVGFHVDSALFQERHEWPSIINVIEGTKYGMCSLFIWISFCLPLHVQTKSRVLFECVYFLPSTPGPHSEEVE